MDNQEMSEEEKKVAKAIFGIVGVTIADVSCEVGIISRQSAEKIKERVKEEVKE